ncbi:MAG TPA: nucleotidyltransferase family protein [Prolixibacteraceae bacterium]
MQLTPEQQILFNLVKISLWPGQDEEVLLSGITQINWEKIISFASRQGVLGVSLDGYSGGKKFTDQLPALKKDQQIRWELSLKSQEARNKRQREAIKELVALFKENGMEMLLLKGIGLSENYPIPSHRECGDIDIYLYGDHEKGNQIMEALGIVVDKQGSKHDNFFFKGIPVENHKTFLDLTSGKINQRLEEHLHKILTEQGFDTIRIDDTEVRIPTPDFTAIFLTRHDITHFVSSGLVLRYLCDLGLFFTRNASSINFSQFFNILEETSQLNLFSAFMNLAQKYLGMPVNSFPALPCDKNLSNRILQDTINIPKKIPPEDLAKWWIVRRKVVGAFHLFRTKWKYDLMDKGFFYRRLSFSVLRAFK